MKQYIPIAQAAKLLNCHKHIIYTMIKRGLHHDYKYDRYEYLGTTVETKVKVVCVDDVKAFYAAEKKRKPGRPVKAKRRILK